MKYPVFLCILLLSLLAPSEAQIPFDLPGGPTSFRATPRRPPPR